ncbi:Hypothetical protein PHPALM_7357, partial [Phytophthora palmivora]
MTMQTIAFLFFVVGVNCSFAQFAAIDEDIRLSEVFGGSHGYAFSDMSSITLGQTLNSITIRGDARIDAISTHVATPDEATWNHGGSGGKEHVLVLDSREYIDTMEIQWGKKNGYTRVFYLKFNTSEGDSVSAGTKTGSSATVTAPEGFQLSGFFGRAAGEVDQLGVIWTRRSAKAAKITDTMGTSWYGKRIRNWVGPTIGANSDTACYRQMEPYNSNKLCPAGYSKNNNNCLAQCPLAYPVACLLECIPQNDDCALEITQKAVAVVASLVNVVTAGIFGAIFTGYKKAKENFLCAANVVGVIRSLVYYIRFQQTTAPQGAVEEMLAVAYQSDVVLVDLPVAVCHCLGIPVPANLQFTGVVMMIVEAIVKQAIINGDDILSSAQNVYHLLQNTSAINSTHTSVDELQDFLDTNSTCGYQLKHLTDLVIRSVNSVRDKNPRATINDIRVIISRSSLVLKDIPAATNNCMDELLSYKSEEAAFKTRDLLRKTFGVIVDQLIETATTDLGKFVAETQYMLEVTNLGLTMLAGLDPTRIVWLASQFVQPTCGPTAFIGDIDDGSLYDALGLTTIDEAFVGSYGTWSKKGDGVVSLIFMSIDTKDVTVVIHSGGQSIAEVKVNAGQTVRWNSTVSKLEDKVLYLDRWRPNMVGISGSGGGSLKLWVPRASKGGHLMLYVLINCSAVMPHLTVLQVVAFFIVVTTTLVASKTNETATVEDIQLSKAYGGPHGNAFSDMSVITLGQTLSSITVRGDARIDAISTHVATPIEATWDHGGGGGKASTLVLDTDEYINSMEIHWGKKGSKTRVFYLKFNTSDGDSVSAGTKTENRATVTAPEGFQLSGFFGRAAGEVDQLGIIWTKRSAKAAKLTDRMGSGWYGKKIRNWVGPTIGAATDTACYRQMEPYNSSNVCPAGYIHYGDMKCIAECPLSYPVSCFLECIPQNDDCALEILQKAAAVVASVVNVATAGILGTVVTMYQSLRREFFCAANVVGVLRSLIYYLRFHQTTAPQGAVQELLAIAYQSEVVTVDLPVAICHCLGLHVPPTLVFSGVVMVIVETIVKQAIVNSDVILSSAENVVYVLENAKVMNSTHTSVVALQDLMNSNSTCGYQLKRLTDHVILSVNRFRTKNP